MKWALAEVCNNDGYVNIRSVVFIYVSIPILEGKTHVNNVQNDSRKGYLVVSNGKLLTQRFLLEIAEEVQEGLLESEREFQ